MKKLPLLFLKEKSPGKEIPADLSGDLIITLENVAPVGKTLKLVLNEIEKS